MSAGQLKHTLAELAEAGVAARVNLWPRVRARASARRPGFALPAWMPRGQRRWAGLAVAALLLVGATAYAAAPVISRLLTMDDQLRTLDAEHAGRALNLSQTQGDVTVLVQWAYADAHRVLVGYTIKTADGRRFDPAGATLTDGRGTVLTSNSGYGVTGHSDILGVSLPPGETTEVVVFNRPTLTGEQPAALKLHFSVNAANYGLPTESATPVVVGNTAQAQPAILIATAGPFEFDFEVPIATAH